MTDKKVMAIAEKCGIKIGYACSHPTSCPDDDSCEIGKSSCLIPYSTTSRITVDQLRAFAAEIEKPLLAEIERMSDLRYKLQGIAADVDAGNGFDIVCRKTLQRVIEGLSAAPSPKEK